MNAPAHTIAALSTPPGRGALAVIRLTGDGSHNVFAGVIAQKEKFGKEPPRRIGIYTVIDNAVPNSDTAETAVDEVTAIKYNAPGSYTGEDMVEIFCHGGTIIPAMILDRLFRQGAKAAGRGEFSRRALVNGKIGILKVESIRELIDSQTETHLRSARLAYFGKQSESIERLKQEVIAVLSDIESRIEFDEDDDVAESKQRLASANKEKLAMIVAELEDELRRGDRIKALDEGIIVTIAGPANAGKSSLFNEILGYDRSIVHDRPGTTRDIVSERLSIDGVTVKLFDSAGIRETGDAVERLGIDRTRAAVAEAHVILWVTSAAEAFWDDECDGILSAAGVTEEDKDNARKGSQRSQDVDIYDNYANGREEDCGRMGRFVVIINKIDKDDYYEPGSLGTDSTDVIDVVNTDTNKISTNNCIDTDNSRTITLPSPSKSHLIDKKRFCERYMLKYVETSITQKLNRERLFDTIGATVRSVMKDVPVPAIIINERHRGIMEAMVGDLRDALENVEREEIAAHCLKTALNRLAEFSGHIGSDEVLNGIFERFCIGK